MSHYIAQSSSSYGEAAVRLELAQTRVMKERLESQLESLDIEIQKEEEGAAGELDARLKEVRDELLVSDKLP